MIINIIGFVIGFFIIRGILENLGILQGIVNSNLLSGILLVLFLFIIKVFELAISVFLNILM